MFWIFRFFLSQFLGDFFWISQWNFLLAVFLQSSFTVFLRVSCIQLEVGPRRGPRLLVQIQIQIQTNKEKSYAVHCLEHLGSNRERSRVCFWLERVCGAAIIFVITILIFIILIFTTSITIVLIFATLFKSINATATAATIITWQSQEVISHDKRCPCLQTGEPSCLSSALSHWQNWSRWHINQSS